MRLLERLSVIFAKGLQSDKRIQYAELHRQHRNLNFLFQLQLFEFDCFTLNMETVGP